MTFWRTFSMIFTVALLAMSLVLQGCSSTSSSGSRGNGPQPDPRISESEEAEFFSRSGLEACVFGGGGAALLCTLIGACDDGGEILAAAAVGCGVAMGANYYLDVRRAEHANRKNQLIAMTEDVSQENAKLESLIATSRDVLEEDKATLAKLQSEIDTQTINRDQARRELAQIDANADYLTGLLVKLRYREREWQKVAQANTQRGGNSAEMQELNREISRLQENIRILEQELDKMLEARSGIEVV